MLSSNLERKIFLSGENIVAGIDEAGRGPLAGPVVAACVACDKSFNFKEKKFKGVNDSKQLTKIKREQIFKILKKSGLMIGVGICNNKIIDKINILQATFAAMSEAINKLAGRPDYLLVDGNMIIPNINIRQRAIIRGDEKVFLIAAASIIAKVTRDRIMEKNHNVYPIYNFKNNKGYCTKEHVKAIKENGPCDIHRKCFFPVSNYFD